MIDFYTGIFFNQVTTQSNSPFAGNVGLSQKKMHGIAASVAVALVSEAYNNQSPVNGEFITKCCGHRAKTNSIFQQQQMQQSQAFPETNV